MAFRNALRRVASLAVETGRHELLAGSRGGARVSPVQPKAHARLGWVDRARCFAAAAECECTFLRSRSRSRFCSGVEAYRGDLMPPSSQGVHESHGASRRGWNPPPLLGRRARCMWLLVFLVGRDRGDILRCVLHGRHPGRHSRSHPCSPPGTVRGFS